MRMRAKIEIPENLAHNLAACVTDRMMYIKLTIHILRVRNSINEKYIFQIRSNNISRKSHKHFVHTAHI